MIKVKCAQCEKSLLRFPCQLNRTKYGPFCNQICLGKYRTHHLNGEWAANFKSGTRRERKYIQALVPWHPKNHNGYVYLHRIIAEARLGRFLKPTEIVHHIDGDTLNNHWTNLMVMSQADHAKDHLKHRRRKKNGTF